MNPVLILTHNGIDFTKRCVESVLAQDIPTSIVLFENGSTDETLEWAKKELPKGSPIIQVPENLGVSFGWNIGLDLLFKKGAEHVLVAGNDTVLPPWTYRELLSYNLPFVTGISVDNMEQIASLPPRCDLAPNPDFSCFLIKREAWEKIGPFDETMKSWASDCDYHYRAHRMGIQFLAANVPFYHIRSRTIELAPLKEKRIFQMQADADRLRFQEKWKCQVWSPQYAELFSPDAFGVDAE